MITTYENGERIKKAFTIRCNKCNKQTGISLELIHDYHAGGVSSEIGHSYNESSRIAFKISCEHCGNEFIYWIENASFPFNLKE